MAAKNMALATITATGGTASRTLGDRFTDRMSVKEFGAAGDGVTDDTADVQAAMTYAGTVGATVHFPAGIYRCLDNITVPLGDLCPDITGEGWNASKVYFIGAAVTNGFEYVGDSGTYPYCGSIRDLHIRCFTGAVRGVSVYGANHPRLERVQIGNPVGACVHFDYTLMGILDHCLFLGGGSATEGNVEVDHSTTFMWHHSRISQSQATAHAGLVIDRTPNVTILGGNIESTQIPIKISSKAQGTTGCVTGSIIGVDLENPGDGHPYIEMGYGWTGSAGGAVHQWHISNCAGYPSGSTSVPTAVNLKNTLGIVCDGNNWSQSGSPTAAYWLDGAQNYGTVIRQHRSMFGYSYPWVMANSVQRYAASPLIEWNADAPINYPLNRVFVDADGTTPNAVCYAQGGLPQWIYLNYASPVIITRILNVQTPMSVSLQAANGNVTLQHGDSGTGGMVTVSGSDLVMGANRVYVFFFDGAKLRQVG